MEDREKKVGSEAEEETAQCGYFSWRPACLRPLSTPRFLLACMCAYLFMQGFGVNGMVWVNLSTWERRYSLSSTEIAWISSSYDISAATFTLIFGYVGQFAHSGRIMAGASLVMAMGSLLMTLPQPLSDPYELGTAPVPLCDLDGNQTSTCGGEEPAYYWFFIAGQILHGVGGSAVYTLGLPYLDDQIKPTNTPLYIGITQGFGVLGPALGFILGGLFLSIYVDVLKVDTEVALDPADPRWVGAWWIGHLAASCGMLLVSLFMACFPRQLPAAARNRRTRNSMVHRGRVGGMASSEQMARSWGQLWAAVKVIFTNPVWLALTIGGTLEIAAIVGFGAFFPKIIQFQFSKPPTAAAIYTGLAVVPAAVVGQMLGGFIPKLLRLRMRGLLVQALVTSVVGVLLSPQFLLACTEPDIAGVTVNYFYNGTNYLGEPDVQHPCNMPCNCTTESYDPICGSDGLEYFSPCFAGCTNATGPDDDETFLQCSCIASDIDPNYGMATNGICEEDCDIFWLFYLMFILICIATFVALTSGTSCVIKCVPEKHKTLATAFLWTFLRLFGQVPGPIIVGLIFDASCLVWQESCGETGACWIYDSDFVSQGIFWAVFTIKCTSCICVSIALLLYQPPTENEDPATIKDVIGDTHVNGHEIGEISVNGDILSSSRRGSNGDDFRHQRHSKDVYNNSGFVESEVTQL